MSWAHDDLLREKTSTNYDQLTPQEKMARCKQKRREQVERWLIFDQSLPDKTKIHFQYHRPRRKHQRKNGNPRKQRTPLVEKLASSENGVCFLPAVALLDAVNSGDVQAVKYMLKIGADPNSADEDGLTALHQACIDNCEEIVKLLLEYGSNVDCRDSEDWTPLHACTTCGHINIAKILLNNGADLLALNADLSMPYDICEDDSPMLEFIESQMEHRNISQEHINAIRAHPENRILQDVRDLWNNSRRNTQTNFQVTSSTASESTDTNQLVQTKSPQINHTTRQNLRSNNFHFDDPIKSNPDRCTLLHIAAANGYIKLCKQLLVGYKANPDCKDRDGWTPLHAACCWSQKECLKMLVENGCDVTMRNKHVEKASEVTDDQEIVALLNHLVREQRQRRRKLEAEQNAAAAAAAAATASKNSNNLETTTTTNPHHSHSFNRSQGSRRSARSQSFRRRSIRKNKDPNSHVTSNSASNLENSEECADPHTSEARLEAAFWRGDVVAPAHQAGESTSSSEPSAQQVHQVSQQQQQRRSNSNPRSPPSGSDQRATAAQRLGQQQHNSPPTNINASSVQRTFNKNQPQSTPTSPLQLSPQFDNNVRNVSSPIPPSNIQPQQQRNKNTGCCVIA